MQSSYIGGLMELSSIHDDIFFLTADSGEGGLELMYHRNFPDRCFDFGIAEENMVAAAAGMALCGKIPFVYAAAPFLVYRSFEFIRNDVCIQNVSVKLFGSGSGISVSSLGPTHHTTEDISLLRSLPNLTIFSPATPKQAYESVKKAYRTKGPVYVRLGVNREQEFFGDDYHIPLAGFDALREGTDAIIVTTGSVLKEVVSASDILRSFGINVSVINVFSIKPFNSECFLKHMKSIKKVFVVEEHSTIGGLGSVVVESLLLGGIYASVKKIGLHNEFANGYGSLDAVRRANGFDADTIASLVREELCQINE